MRFHCKSCQKLTISNGEFCTACGKENDLALIEEYKKDPLLNKMITKAIAEWPFWLKSPAAIDAFRCQIERTKDVLDLARHFESVGRYEDAARYYESLGAYDEARELRENSITIKHVNVDLNQLIEQLNHKGVTLNYKCPNCGAPINISGVNADGLKFCNYCGSALDIVRIEEIIKKALS